ncbi:SDR family oxidoreductase [Bacillus alkalicellulosilyticus]|uniref:SDR family oxidoreductase n=1 Tax=Alkalihalobacterium alkalicellulosilyticum TaxID=1912214 RepID=UPI00099644A0|nr:SDR family oxidoreductase [Bacillus alkalicellulosilyticus]
MYPVYPYYDYRQTCTNQPLVFPPQHQQVHPGLEYVMVPRPIAENLYYQHAGKLHGKVALITGGDSGIGRAVTIAFAKEGADVAIVYYNEHEDAQETKERVEQLGRSCLLLQGDLGDSTFAKETVAQTINAYGKIDILINNHAVQYVQESLLDISDEQWEHTFRTNVTAYFYVTKAALPYLKSGSAIINTTSVTAYQGHEKLIDYSCTRGAIVTFTRSLALSLAKDNIRVNAVAPGPIWTPLIPSSFPAEEVETFGTDVPMKRPGQPFELAPTYVYLASVDSSYVTGQVLHVNGGRIVGG